MRPLEITLLFTLVILLILFWVRRTAAPWLLISASTITILITIAHVALEGQRWQMLPAYGLTAVLALILVLGGTNGLLIGRATTIIVSVLATPLVLIAIALPLILPVPDTPEPSGHFPVGTASYHLIDATRPEIYTDAPDDVREIMVQFWYPAAAEQAAVAASAPYLTHLDIVAPLLARRFGFPSFLMNHLGLIQTASKLDVPVAAVEPHYPVIIFSPGYNSLRNQSTALMEELASHGYIVIAIDHTYVEALTIFPDGRIEFLSPTALPDREEVGDARYWAAAELIGEVWTKDVQFVLNRLETESIDSRFTGRLDLTRTGILGHSTGSGVAAILIAIDSRFQVGVGMDTWMGPVPDTILAQGTERPFLFLMSELWPTEENKADIRQYVSHSPASNWLTIAGTEHYDFTDLPLFTPFSGRIGLSGPINSYRAQTIVRAYVLAYFDQMLKGEQSSISFTEPEEAFPEVKISH